jgi:hypothetical protein
LHDDELLQTTNGVIVLRKSPIETTDLLRVAIRNALSEFVALKEQ